MKPGEYVIVLGDELAKALGVGMGGRIVIVTSLRTTTPAGVMPRMSAPVAKLKSGYPPQVTLTCQAVPQLAAKPLASVAESG